MTKSKEFCPKGYHAVTHTLVVDDAAKAIEFYKKALGAKERMRSPGPNGTILHAEIEIGDSVIMLSDEFPQGGLKSPKSLGGSTSAVWLYVPNVDAAFKKAVAAGATVEQPVNDMFWGDRFGAIRDPFGHQWSIATHTDDYTPDEMAKLQAEQMKDFGGS